MYGYDTSSRRPNNNSATLLIVTQLGDYHVRQPTSGNGDHPPRGRAIAVATVVLVALAIGLYWYFGRGVDEPPVETAVESTPDPILRRPIAVDAEPEPAVVPPVDLSASDEFIRNAVGTISSHPRLAEWLVNDRLIQRFVVVVDNIADGSNPAQHVPSMRPETRFTTAGEGPTLRVDPQSYSRYDLHAQIIASLDTRGTADLYLMLVPLMNEAYVELGNPERPFSQTLERAIVSILSTPIVDDPPTLVEYAPFFQYADPNLESLPPAQKQLLGMGPDNIRTIQAKLRQIALAVGISDSRLP
jgi:hypothetical protein